MKTGFVERLIAATVAVGVLALSAASAAAGHSRSASHSQLPAVFYVGAAKADVTPSDLTNFYLGGYGIGPVHEAKSVLRHIYFRVIAIRDRRGHQVVIGSLDSQGYSLAYQNGPYGFSDVESYVQQHLGIPASNVVLQATHSHNGPDEIGVWGGVPNSYFAFVTGQMESAITQAVAAERRALLHVGTADMAGFSGTFGSGPAGDLTDYPIDQQLRVLQAVDPRTKAVIATLLNYSSHPTVYGPLNAISPDWPGAAATYLEHDEQDMPAGVSYGYPGSTAIVTVGALGHTWPRGVPAGEAGIDPPQSSDNNFPADHFGNAVAQRAIDALSGGHGFYLTDSSVGGATRDVYVENTNPVLLAGGAEPANSTPLGGYKIDRSLTPPWGYGDVFVSLVTTLRVGDLPLYGVPGEPYPSIKFSLDTDIHAPVQFVFGLANDQLGYVEEPADYPGAFQCSLSDEWFFTISPIFGSDVVRLSRANAQELGFKVSGNPLDSYGPGPLPPSLNCTVQQFSGSGLPGLPTVPGSPAITEEDAG